MGGSVGVVCSLRLDWPNWGRHGAVQAKIMLVCFDSMAIMWAVRGEGIG